MCKTKLVVINENTLGYIMPEMPKYYSTLHASILKGAIFELWPGPKLISSNKIRLASAKDFDDYRVCFKGFDNKNEYEFDSVFCDSCKDEITDMQTNYGVHGTINTCVHCYNLAQI